MTCFAFAAMMVGVRVLDLNFNNGNVDNWGLESDNLDAWALGIVPVNGSTKAPSNTLRAMETALEGSVTVSYAPEIQLEAGKTYKLAFTGRTSYVPMAVGHADWSAMTIGLSGGAFSGLPENGVDLGLGWYRYESKFTVEEDHQAGANFLTFDGQRVHGELVL
ncbi:hypothetical protein B0J13DRAFT_675209 [Dactylonectria estremocensis]|uniref:CBM-cenC domain-containing protein n=1 Tax=Dactylonectria estremocensis TaxID=1079267 RepID=A0A9P9ETY3_9HYPO|nr:hypothetical protein B0J13DRAFT_675209 [Dactylonectria estremocensis]